MFRPDDVTLIQRFVTGASSFEANQNLQVQPVNQMRQLFSRRGAVLAIADPAAHPPTICIRQTTEFSELLNRVLLAYHYIPIRQNLDTAFFRYEHQKIPTGYQVHYEPARNLWRQWWIRYHHFKRQGIQMELLVQIKTKWYPIRDIILDQGTLYVTTHLGETAHMGDDLIVWLELGRITTPLTQAQVPAPSPTPQAVPSSSQAKAAKNEVGMSKALQSVVRFVEGRLYIQTAIGEVIVEGHFSGLRVSPNCPTA